MTISAAVTGIWFLPKSSGYSYRFTNEAGTQLNGHAWRGETGEWEHNRLSQMDSSGQAGHLLAARSQVAFNGLDPSADELAAINAVLDTRDLSRLR